MRLKRNSNPDAASSSQDGKGMLHWISEQGDLSPTDKDQQFLNYSENFCTAEFQSRSARIQRISRKPGNSSRFRRLNYSEISESRIWPHHFHVSPYCAPHMEKVL